MNKIASIVIFYILCGGFFLHWQPALSAQEKNAISASVAQGKTGETPRLDVSSYGLILSFESLQESIEKYWAADDTYLRAGTNAPLGPEANILFLKTEGKWSGSKSGTSLTVRTRKTNGETNTYSFLVEFTNNKPKYSIVRISPSPELDRIFKQSTTSDVQSKETPEPSNVSNATPLPRQDVSVKQQISNTVDGSNSNSVQKGPVIKSKPAKNKSNAQKLDPKPQVISKSVEHPDLAPTFIDNKSSQPAQSTPQHKVKTATQTSPKTYSRRSILKRHEEANAIVRGLSLAMRSGEIGEKSSIGARVQSVVLRLRRGEKLEEALRLEQVNREVIERLLQLGSHQKPSSR